MDEFSSVSPPGWSGCWQGEVSTGQCSTGILHHEHKAELYHHYHLLLLHHPPSSSSSSSSSLASASSSYFPPPPALFFEALQDALVKLPKKPGRLRALYPVSCISWALRILGETQDWQKGISNPCPTPTRCRRPSLPTNPTELSSCFLELASQHGHFEQEQEALKLGLPTGSLTLTLSALPVLE